MASIVYCMAQFLVAVPDAVLGPTLLALGHQISCRDSGEICPEMLEAIGWNRTGAAISVLLAWLLSQFLNGHYSLAMGFAMISASFLICPFSTTPYQIHVSFFFIGIGKGLASLNSTALMVALRQGNKQKLRKWVNLLSIFWGLGSISTPLLVSLTTLKDFRLSFFSVGIMCLSLSLVVFYVRFKVPDRKHPPSTFRISRQRLSSCRAYVIMVLGYLFAFVAVGVEFNIVAYITPYIESLKIGSNTTGNFITSSYSFAFMLGRIISGYLELQGVSPLVILDSCMLVATLLAALVSMYPTSMSVIWLGAVGWGMFLSPSWPCTLIILRQTGPLSELMVQMFIFAIYCGQWTLDLIMDRIIQEFGTKALTYGLSCALLSALLIVITISVVYHSRPSAVSNSPKTSKSPAAKMKIMKRRALTIP